MKEKRIVYIVERDGNDVFKVFDTLEEAKVYILHEYLKWFDTNDSNSEDEKLRWFIEDVRSIDEHAYIEELFYLHEAEYGGD